MNGCSYQVSLFNMFKWIMHKRSGACQGSGNSTMDKKSQQLIVLCKGSPFPNGTFV